MKLIRLYPSVYVDVCKNTALFCNVAKQYIQQFDFEKIIKVPNKTSLIVSEFNNNHFIDTCIEKFGRVDDIGEYEIDVLTDYFTDIDQYYKKTITQCWESWYVGKNYITRLTVDLTGRKNNPFSCARECSNMSEKVLSCLFKNIHKLEKLESIYFESNWETLIILSMIIKRYPLVYYKTRINIEYEDYLQHENEILLLYEQINVIIYDVKKTDIESLSKLLKTNRVQSVFIEINNCSDYETYSFLASFSPQKIRIKIGNKIHLDDLHKLLLYDKCSVLESVKTKVQLIKQEYINTLYWGEMIVCSNGDVLLNQNSCVGNVIDWDNIEFCLLINSDKSLWRMVRNKYEPCIQCLYRNLCPSLTMFESQNNTVFCTHN